MLSKAFLTHCFASAYLLGWGEHLNFYRHVPLMTSVFLLYCSCGAYRYDLFIYWGLHVYCCMMPFMPYNQDIEIGKAVRPQLAMRVRDASAAWKKVVPQTFPFSFFLF